ncbi:transporter [Heyndrickxia sporothermodurans]
MYRDDMYDRQFFPPGFPQVGGGTTQGFPSGQQMGTGQGFPGFPQGQSQPPGMTQGFPSGPPPGAGQGFPSGPPPGAGQGFPSGPPTGGSQSFPPGPPPGMGQGTSQGPSTGMGGQTTGPSTYAVDPGAFQRCMHRITRVRLRNGQRFWFYPTFIGRTSVAGYRWINNRWRYEGLDTNRIVSFSCS